MLCCFSASVKGLKPVAMHAASVHYILRRLLLDYYYYYIYFVDYRQIVRVAQFPMCIVYVACRGDVAIQLPSTLAARVQFSDAKQKYNVNVDCGMIRSWSQIHCSKSKTRN